MGDSVAVLYGCGCGSQLPLDRLYLCVQCQKLHCDTCVRSEIECLYCPTCLVTLVQRTEAQKNANRCVQCCVCPVCRSTLSHHSGEDRRVYLVCGTCRWASTEVGLLAARPHELPAECQERERQADAVEVANQLTDHFKAVELVERQQAEERLGLAGKQRRSGGIRLVKTLAAQRPKPPRVPAVPDGLVAAVEDGGSDSEDWDGYTAEHAREQRINLASRKGALYPQRRQLCARLCLRCAQCDSGLVMYGKSPAATKLKHCVLAMAHVPHITVHTLPALQAGKDARVVLTITNPVEAVVQVELKEKEGGAGSKVVVSAVSVSVGAHNPVQSDMADLLDDVHGDEEASAVDPSGPVLWRRHNQLRMALTIRRQAPCKSLQVHVAMHVAREDAAGSPSTYAISLGLGSVAP
eukprot:comp23763_c0_seq1/m.41149 comp23763_c0_seq1/g.41149  ORF comp23763_c0_seq1/g.41149 comp23763_c0_seq1/m.41149 type:complete len:409 (-) comp23763_c0_seq1:110-1336(-)